MDTTKATDLQKHIREGWRVQDFIDSLAPEVDCGERRAEEYLAAELRNLRELRDAGALCYGDLETACSGLGLDFDYTDYFCRALSLN